jgi:outer membrane protein assembly factor BamB
VAAGDGSKVWSFDSTCCDGPTLVLDKKGLVYAGGSDGNLYALDAKTGKQQWNSDFITDAQAAPPNFSGDDARLANTKARPTALASDGEMLLLSVFDQSRLVAVDAATGKRLWSFQTRGWVWNAAVATGQHVFFGSQDRFFYCLDKKSGKQVWKFETKLRITSAAAVDGKLVYFASCDGNVYCLNQFDGAKQWHFATDLNDRGGGPIYSAPIFSVFGLCIATGEGQTYMVNRETGRLQWKIRPAGRSELFCSPASEGTHIFVVSRAKDKDHGAPSLVAIGLK